MMSKKHSELKHKKHYNLRRFFCLFFIIFGITGATAAIAIPLLIITPSVKIAKISGSDVLAIKGEQQVYQYKTRYGKGITS
jgi:hypothetical protein